MNVQITIKYQPEAAEEEAWTAYAYTEGVGTKGVGISKDKAIKNLHKKIKQMNTFARLVKTTLELKHLKCHKVNETTDNQR